MGQIIECNATGMEAIVRLVAARGRDVAGFTAYKSKVVRETQGAASIAHRILRFALVDAMERDLASTQIIADRDAVSLRGSHCRVGEKTVTSATAQGAPFPEAPFCGPENQRG